MEAIKLKPIVESLIFVSEEPITEIGIMLALAETGVERAEVRSCIEQIEKEWNGDDLRGIGLVQVAGGYQFRTKTGFAEWLKKLNIPKPMRLTAQSLETLAIVAYRQPIVRSEIERIRGVDSGAVLKTLLERRLLRIVGRRDEPGQPLLYGTTKEFLEIFNLKALAELPTLKDIEELMRERRTLTQSQAGELNQNDDKDDKGSEDDDFDDEEPTDVIDDEDVDESAVNFKEDEKDMEALSELEHSLKGLRRIERNIFPREVAEGLEEVMPGGTDAAQGLSALKKATGGGETGKVGGGKESGTDENRADAAPADDSALK